MTPFLRSDLRGARSREISSDELQIWFARPKNERTSVGVVGVGNSDSALVRDGSILYPFLSRRNPPNKTSFLSH